MTALPSFLEGLGIELELGALLVMAILGTSLFDRFEAETAAWRKMLRWSFAALATLGAYAVIGHWSLLVLVGLGLAGTAIHFGWCRKNGVNPLTAEPRQRYYELRGWPWPPK
jgi:hypothetical protein